MSRDDTPDTRLRPTNETYGRFQQVYELYNKRLFDDALPNCLITLQRRRRSYGYFCGDRFGREDGKTTDEIALNPSHFRDRPLTEVLATLAHEMVHLWQHHHGTPGRGRYHNREWADKMKVVGLQPTDTGEEGGKETGDSVHHLVVPDGSFERLTKSIIAKGFAIRWKERPRIAPAGAEEAAESATTAKEKKSGKRIRYLCSHDDCGQKAWAKHDANLICGDHMAAMVPSPSET